MQSHFTGHVVYSIWVYHTKMLLERMWLLIFLDSSVAVWIQSYLLSSWHTTFWEWVIYRFVLVHTGASACMGSQSKQYQSKVLAPVWYKIEPHNGLHRYILAVPICNEPGAKLSHPTQQCTLCSMIMFTTVVNLRSQNICNFSPFDFVFWLAFLPHVHSSTCCFVFWPWHVTFPLYEACSHL